MNFNKKQKLILLLFLTLGLTLTSLNFLQFNSLQLTNNTDDSNTLDFDDQNTFPETAEYQTYDGSGEQLNITLHQ